jgi:phosphate transport system permease protein
LECYEEVLVVSAIAQGNQGYTRRKITDRIGTGLAIAALIAALIPLGAVVIYVLVQGGSSLNAAFFTQAPATDAVGNPSGGMAPMIVGTLVLVTTASLIGIPVGILSGIHLARYGNRGFGQTVRFVTDVVAGTPSIVAGMVVFALVVIPTGQQSAFIAALALAILMFPTVTRATEEAVRAVPTELREAALALGAPEWKTMLRVTLPTASAGIVTAIVLGVARVAGETAPLIFLIGIQNQMSWSPFGPISALPTQIWNYSQQPQAFYVNQAWAGAFVLFSLILALNLIARVLTSRLSKRARMA